MPESKLILIADDDTTIRTTLGEYLSTHGYRIELAADSTEAEAKLKNHAVDLLISDIQMPGNDELDFLKSAVEKYPNLPAIIITAHPTLPTAVKSLRLRVVDYISKPLRYETMLALIQKTLEKGRVIDGIRAFRQNCKQLDDQLAGVEEVFSLKMDRKSDEPGEVVSSVMDVMLSQVVRSTLNLRMAFELLSQPAAQTPPQSQPAVGAPFCRSIQCPVRLSNEEMLRETIQVLEKTKNSFKSKELADLRKKIEMQLMGS